MPFLRVFSRPEKGFPVTRSRVARDRFALQRRPVCTSLTAAFPPRRTLRGSIATSEAGGNRTVCFRDITIESSRLLGRQQHPPALRTGVWPNECVCPGSPGARLEGDRPAAHAPGRAALEGASQRAPNLACAAASPGSDHPTAGNRSRSLSSVIG